MGDSQRDGRNDDWRKELNRAVRVFASLEALDETTLSAAVETMLRDIGEAVKVDSVALVEMSDGATHVTPWYWSMRRAGRHPLEAPALDALLEQARLRRDPFVLQHFPSESSLEHANGWAALRRSDLRSVAIVSVGAGDVPRCVWLLGSSQASTVWEDSLLEHLQVLGEIVAGALPAHRKPPDEIRGYASASQPSARGRDVPAVANFRSPLRFEEILGESSALRGALSRLEEVANTESTVLLLGETGTGKELFARAIHVRSSRRNGPLISVNCGALPPTLIESELFGHQRGAFTGALELRKGRFELAHRGTLFLDEIGDLPPEVQVKLLRVLQEGAFERVGSSHSCSVDVRIIAATHRDLARAVAEGEFRADLYYRLNVFPIRLPPLRERREDIPVLVWSIIGKRQHAIHRHVKVVPEQVMDTLKRHSWPGNIRELENVVERALIHSTGDTLTLLDWNPETLEIEPSDGTTLKSVERTHIQEVLRECGWKINGLGNAAERLGLHPNTLRFRMKKLGIVRHESIDDRRRLRSTPEARHPVHEKFVV